MEWRHRHTVLALTAAALFATVSARLVISPVVPDVLATFDVSAARLGVVLSGMWAAYALFQLPGGVVADRFGERTAILAALGLSAVGSAALAGAPGFGAFAAAAVFLGAGAGLYFTAATSLLTGAFRNTGQALGFHEAGASLAGLLAPVAAAVVGARYGWRPAILLGAALVLPVFVLVAIRVGPSSDAYTGSASRPIDVDRLRRLVARPPIAYSIFLAVISAFVWQGVASFFPTYLIQARGFSTEAAGVTFALIFALATLALPALGRLSDVLSRDGVLVAALFVSAAGLVLASAARDLPVAVAGAGLIGLGFGWPSVIQSRIMDRFEAADRAVGFGVVRTIYLLIGSTGSAVTGAIGDAVGWGAAIATLGALFVVAALTLVANRLLGLGW